MSDMNQNNIPEEDMIVELDLECGTVKCQIVTILEVNEQDYIVLLPEPNPLAEEGEVWFYRYSENPDNPNEEPELGYIESDEEFELVEDAYDEFLDNVDFED